MKIGRYLSMFAGIAILLFASLSTISIAKKLTYEDLSEDKKKVVDLIIDEFQRHYLIFMPDLSSDVRTLYAVASITESEILKRSQPKGKGEGDNPNPNHDHRQEEGNEDYKTARLVAKVLTATPDSKGEYHTPTLKFIPGKVFTYAVMYTVTIDDKSIRVDVSKAEKGRAQRMPVEPDRKFLDSLAKRLGGKIVGNDIVLP